MKKKNVKRSGPKCRICGKRIGLGAGECNTLPLFPSHGAPEEDVRALTRRRLLGLVR
jgi:hypothetical protein